MNILVVDDDEQVRTLLRRLLQCEGHRGLTAADGVEALEVLQREPVGVIITDIMMPRMDGYRLCQAVRGNERLKDIPFIFHTATYTSPADEKLALGMGADLFLRKPANVETILEAVRRVTSQPRVARPRPVAMPELDVLREYSDRLVAKLEQRNVELGDKHRLLRAVVDGLPACIFVKDAAGHYLLSNESHTRLLEARTEAELLNKTVFDFFPSEVAEAFDRDDKELLRTGTPVIQREEVSEVQGKDRWFLQTKVPLRDQRGEIIGLVGIKQDITERKQVEQALHESEAALAMVFRTSPALISIATVADGRLIHVNERYCEFFGYTSAEMIGKTVNELNLWANPADRVAAVGRLKQEGVIHGLEVRCRLRSGEVRHALGSMELIDLAGESEPVLISIFTDITERKQAEEALTQRARLAALVAEVSVALTRKGSLQEVLQHCTAAMVKHLDAAFARIWTLNEAASVLELQASAGMYTHLNGPHGRVPVGQFKIGLIAQERQPHLTNSVVGDPRVGDQEWARREGMVAFAGYPLLVEDRLVGVVAMFARHPLSEATLAALGSVADGVASGIERKRAEEKLNEERKLLRTMVDNLPAFVFVKDAAGRYLLVNEAHQRQLGMEGETEMLGKTSFDFFPEEVARRFAADDQAVIQTGQPVIEREESFEAGDKRGWFLTTKVPLRDAQGNIIGLVGIAQDITARKQADEVFKQRAAELERFHRLSTGRELQMIELKKEVNELAGLAGRAPPYDLSFMEKGEQP